MKLVLFITLLLLFTSCTMATAPVKEDISSSLDFLENKEIFANGTEPFWGFTASGNILVERLPGIDSPEIRETVYNNIEYSGDNASFELSGSGVNAVFIQETCSDGMSDRVYEYSVEYNNPENSYSGCANVEDI